MYIAEANIHSFKDTTCSSYSLISKYKCRDEIVKNTHLIRTHPTTSHVAATFHPTIGQRDHQSLSNTATRELGMIPPGIRVNAGLHIAKEHNQQANTAGFIRPSADRPS